MGTRNLTCVVIGSEYKIAQYGQWDGYPSGQGGAILEFISEEGNLERLKEKLGRCRFWDAEGRDKQFLEEYNANSPKWSNDPDNRTEEQIRWFHTYIHRDLGGRILEAVASSEDKEILLHGMLDFAGDSLSCEWAYVIDFDKSTFEVYMGFNTETVDPSERFAVLPVADNEFDNGRGGKYTYKQVKHIVTFNLKSLPSYEEFITKASPAEEE